MITSREFDLTIPTHIQFTLYKYDYIDSIIISRVLKECRNLNKKKDTYTVRVSDFTHAVIGSRVILKEIANIETYGLSSNPDFKPNSIHFIWTIIKRLINLEFITFKVSYDKDFSRIIRSDDKEIQNFYYKIVGGILDLTKIFTQDEIDEFNKKLIELGYMSNKYLLRSNYLRISTHSFYDLVDMLDAEGRLKLFNIYNLDPKLEEDNPQLMIKTDYSLY